MAFLPSEVTDIRKTVAARCGHHIQHLHQCCICCILSPTELSIQFTVILLRGDAQMTSSTGSYTTSDLSRKSGDIIAEALRHPVTITQRNKPRLVLLNIEDYERLMRQSDMRAAGTLETMPDSLLAEFESAVDAYADSDETNR